MKTSNRLNRECSRTREGALHWNSSLYACPPAGIPIERSGHRREAAVSVGVHCRTSHGWIRYAADGERGAGR
jgi:hypothetical protein